MEIEVRNSQRKFRIDRQRIARLAERALGRLGLEDAQLSIVLVSDRKIRDLNLRYRRIDRHTDVLSFSQQGGVADYHGDVLGDVVISAESASRQAGRYRRTLEREIDILLVHGILHLAGFDHEGSSREKARMDSWKRKILQGWNG